MKKVLVLIVLSFLFVGCSSNINNDVNNVERKMISVNEVENIIKNYQDIENVFIIDVREFSEYEEGHLSNSVNIPLGNIESVGDIYGIEKESKIIVYCRSGNRSKTAQVMLEKLGYTNVYDMGGVIDWPYDIEKSGDE